MLKKLFIPGAVKVLFKARGVEEEDFVPIEYTNLWSLADAPVVSERKGKKTIRLRRLSMSRPYIQDGEIKTKPAFRLDACDFEKADKRITPILESMLEAEFSIFSEDLPVYFDALHTPADQLNWNLLTRDLIVTLNSKKIKFVIPDTKEGNKLKEQLNKGELSLYDIDNHACGILGDDLLMELIDQLIGYFIVSYKGMKLMPARWLEKVSNQSLYARVEKSVVIKPRLDRGPRVKVGAFNLGLGGVA